MSAKQAIIDKLQGSVGLAINVCRYVDI